MTHRQPGKFIRPRQLETISAERIAIPDAELLTQLQFRRCAGCPVCILHLRIPGEPLKDAQ
jgi:hypothetical protein